MNTKEIQQVMSNITYVSLYDYLGRSTSSTCDGIRVAELALEKGIKPKYQMLPESCQTDKFKSVATWPIDFLDTIYKRTHQVVVRQDEFIELKQKVQQLEQLINKITNVTNSNVGPADDLPF